MGNSLIYIACIKVDLPENGIKTNPEYIKHPETTEQHLNTVVFVDTTSPKKKVYKNDSFEFPESLNHKII